MLAQDAMRSDVPYVTENSTAEHAAQLMRDENVGFLPVLDDEESRRLVGVLTDRDLALEIVAENLHPRDVTVGLIATRVVVAVSPTDDLTEVERKLEAAEIRRLPVLDDQGVLLGVISLHDLAQLEPEKRTGEIFKEVAKTSARSPEV